MKLISIRRTFICLSFVFTLFACEKRPQIPSNKFIETDSTSTEMLKLNKLLVEVEQKEIKAYLDTCKSKFSYSETGFWYTKTKDGSGEKIEKGKAVVVEYQVETLSGKVCYSYIDKNKKNLIAGKSEQQIGFNKGLTSLKEGDQAILIVPSNLAFGVMGDKKSIPPRATLIYRIISIKLL